MNCQDIGRILNDDDVAALSPVVARNVREHLAACDECARDWKVHERMLAMPMPLPGPGLLGWRPVNRGADAAATKRRPLRGTLIVGALIAFGAAAAVYLGVEQAGSVRDTEPPAALPASNAASSQDEPVGAAADSSPVSTEELNLSAMRASRSGYPYAFTLMLVPSRQGEMLATLETALLDRFRAIPHLILIEPASFDRYLDPDGSPIWPLQEGVDYVVQLRRMPTLADIEALTGQLNIEVATWVSGDNRIRTAKLSGISDLPLGIEEARSVIDDLFEWFGRILPPEDLSVLTEVRNTALDSTRSPEERVGAFDALNLFTDRFVVFDEDVQQEVRHSIAITLIEIVTNSTQPAIRGFAWIRAFGLGDPYLIVPAAEALRRDPTFQVRHTAAKLLVTDFSSDPVARAALDFAALNDSNIDVRHYAGWANADESGRQALLIEMLSDVNVPQHLRYEVVRESAIVDFKNYVTRESAELLLGIAAAQPETVTWSNITSVLGNAPPGEVVPLLLQRLRDDPDAAIRRLAAGALIGHQDEPGVGEALRFARDYDPSPEVRLATFTAR